MFVYIVPRHWLWAANPGRPCHILPVREEVERLSANQRGTPPSTAFYRARSVVKATCRSGWGRSARSGAMPDRGPVVRPGPGERPPPFAAVLRPPVGREPAAAAAEPGLAVGCRSGGAGGAVTPTGRMTAPRAPVGAVWSRLLA